MSHYIRTLHTGRRAPLAGFTLAALGLAAALTLAGPGHAQSPVTPTAAVAGASTQELSRLLEQLTKHGYTDIREVERKSDKLVEVKARNAAGQRVELSVDSRSGEVLREKRDH